MTGDGIDLFHPDRDPGRAAGRYAPSPTGRLHLGNLRTALLAWRSARERGAPFLLRIEDVDSGRSREEWVEVQLEELRQIGIDWDGEPVRQSARHELYREALAKLEGEDLLYECFCTRAEIREAASAPHGELPEGAYPGTCRDLTEAEREERRADGRPPALRVRAAGARVGFEDHVCGRVEKTLDDFVVRRNDGDFAYNLAVTVDDAEQRVGEVVRGADLLDTTPRQLWLYDRLGIDAPDRFSHVPLMLGEDGERLAKRHGAITLEERIEAGQSAEQIRRELLDSDLLLP
ncbi:MAG: tRNA glutamyl-Q(34) synthetase GluQRS [Solirubrobacterales bacterium 67-14]|nr:MAG: tRNA glutamyl-Q(34) synthetase GluQRS [Solirubrobacterales bacterium 67-14]